MNSFAIDVALFEIEQAMTNSGVKIWSTENDNMKVVRNNMVPFYYVNIYI